MIVIDIKERIHSPIDRVFRRLVDINGYNNWMPKESFLIEAKQFSEGPVQQGTTFADRTKIGMARGIVNEFIPNEKVGFRQSLQWLGIPVGESRPSYTLREEDGITHLHHHAEGNFYGILKLFESVFQPLARAERQRTVSALKKSLETM